MQQITITGYLSRDAEQSTTRGGDPVTRWNVPVRQGWGENEKTNWYKVAIWGKRGQYASNARKGDFVTVTGDLTIGEWEGKPQYEVRANDFQFINMSGEKRDGSQGHAQTSQAVDDLDDAIPF